MNHEGRSPDKPQERTRVVDLLRLGLVRNQRLHPSDQLCLEAMVDFVQASVLKLALQHRLQRVSEDSQLAGRPAFRFRQDTRDLHIFSGWRSQATCRLPSPSTAKVTIIPFHLSFVAASFDCPRCQNSLSAVWRLHTQSESFWR